MTRFQESLYRLPRFLLAWVASVLTVAQVLLAFLLRGPGPIALQWAGWICVWASAVFAILPIVAFRRQGGVSRGESYMKTTVLVDTGIYSIVRHPQGGTAWLLINLGVMLIAWHWTSLALGLVSLALVYADTFKADQYCIEKFGDAYRRYMQAVPRVNFVLGIVRLFRPSGDRPGGQRAAGWNALVNLLAMESYEDLEPIQRVAHLAFWYDAEVQNGGHLQYFENRGTDLLEPTLDALAELNALGQRHVLDRAGKLYLSKSRQRISTAEEYVAVALEGEFDELDREYYDCAPAITHLLEGYLEAHRDRFIEPGK